MTQPSVDVDTQALYDRADDLEKMIEELSEEEPPEFTDPDPPCNLDEAIEAVNHLKSSAKEMRKYMKTGYQEWGRLAESLRNAAQSYEEVDEDAARALRTFSGSVSPATLGPADEAGLVLGLSSDDEPAGPKDFAIGHDEYWEDFYDAYQELSKVCGQVEAGDGGRSCDDFAEAWKTYGSHLFDATDCFVPFPSESWEGEAAEAVNQSFEQQRQWLRGMKDLCDTMAYQAEQLSKAQSWLLDTHILYNGDELHQQIEVEKIENDYAALDDRAVPHRPKRKQYSQKLADLQATSDAVLAEYPMQAGMPLSIVNPSPAPHAYTYVPPSGSGPGSWPTPGSGLPDPTSMPIVGSVGASPTPTDAPMPYAVKDAMRGGPAVKPASVGGGGIPSMPLQPAVDAGSVAAARELAGPGRATPGAGGGAMGGGGMGMAPMGHGGQGQNQGKGKRSQQDDESLYTEERPWTEGYIGNLRRRDIGDDEAF